MVPVKSTSKIPSPCRQICVLNNVGYCIGCGRKKEEITEWIRATDERKQQILERIKDEQWFRRIPTRM